MNTRHYSIADEFSAFPIGRTRKDGEFNGTTFRDDILAPMLEEFETVILSLDGIGGFPSSFSEEVFGGCIKHGYLGIQDIDVRLQLETKDESLKFYIPIAYKYAKNASGKA